MRKKNILYTPKIATQRDATNYRTKTTTTKRKFQLHTLYK